MFVHCIAAFQLCISFGHCNLKRSMPIVLKMDGQVGDVQSQTSNCFRKWVLIALDIFPCGFALICGNEAGGIELMNFWG